MSKEVKKGSWESRGAQKYEISVVCEILQPKIDPYENGHLLRNDFATLRCPLRNQGLAAKIALPCKMISQPNTPLCENFRSYETPSWHTSAISQHSNSISQLRNLQSMKSPIFAVIAPFRRVFRSCETPLWHTSAISQHSNSIS